MSPLSIASSPPSSSSPSPSPSSPSGVDLDGAVFSPVEASSPNSPALFKQLVASIQEEAKHSFEQALADEKSKHHAQMEALLSGCGGGSMFGDVTVTRALTPSCIAT